jgi:DNA-binding HxlR family transcriptional regulator
MNKLDLTDATCVSSLKLLGDFHILRIIDTLQDGPIRFCNIQRQLDNLNPVTLTDRLKKLEQAGIVDRHEDDENSVHYSLTATGRAALPVLDAINTFSSVTSSVK